MVREVNSNKLPMFSGILPKRRYRNYTVSVKLAATKTQRINMDNVPPSAKIVENNTAETQ